MSGEPHLVYEMPPADSRYWPNNETVRSATGLWGPLQFSEHPGARCVLKSAILLLSNFHHMYMMTLSTIS